MKSALWLALAVAAPLAAQAPAKCDTPDHRAFDFWIGDWNVTMGGKPAGTNLITLEESDCVIHEHWVGSLGGTGQSFNFFDRRLGQWRQFWIDNTANSLELTGSFRDGKMTLIGTTPAPKGPIQQKITWFKNDDGTVRQLWESSADAGKTWSVSFDGLYRKKA